MPTSNQITNKHHVHTREGGYVEQDYKHQPYPRWVKDPATGKPAVVQNRQEEFALTQPKKD